MRQRWRDLLFAHWPVAPAAIRETLPSGLEVDCHEGEAWLGVVPFWMDHVRHRVVGQHALGIPTVRSFSELNLRTYVRSRATGRRGVYFYALDCSSPLAVLGARLWYHLPYFPARIHRRTESTGEMVYSSRRSTGRLAGGNVVRGARPRVELTYGPAGPEQPTAPGSLAAFLTERYCLFTCGRKGQLLRGEIHHQPWPLQPAHAEFRCNELAQAHGFTLPAEAAPVLHFARSLDVVLWSLRPEEPAKPRMGRSV